MEPVTSALTALLQVIVIDLMLAVDNVILVGLIASGVPAEMRKRVIFLGILFATLFRIFFAVIVSHLLDIIGLLLAGGLLLLWAAWKMWREARSGATPEHHVKKPKTWREAVTLIVLADIAMSLDNVLGVAGAAREHMWVLVTGLALSVFLMAVSSTFIASILTKHRWLIYVGLLVILHVALSMIWDGGMQVWVASQPLFN